MNRPGIIKFFGAIALVIASFFGTLAVVDYFGFVPPRIALPIRIEEATYGANCGSRVKSGNATDQVSKACNGRFECDVLISVRELGDPAQGCLKDFLVRYQCGQQQPARRAIIKGEANGSNLKIDCQG
jgi:hypothetical protein